MVGSDRTLTNNQFARSGPTPRAPRRRKKMVIAKRFSPSCGVSGSPGLSKILERLRNFGVDSRRNGSVTTASLVPFTLMRTDSIGDSLTGFGDLYPLASLKWNMGGQ